MQPARTDIALRARPCSGTGQGAAARVSIVIPTQRRPSGLARAVRSAFRQSGVRLAELELVIVDNDETPSAEPLARALAAEAPFHLVYVHEPAPGVSNARNAALAVATGGLIAFLDDDEEAFPGWLAALLRTQARFEADVVFGPVRGRAPERVGDHRLYLERFFSREGPSEEGLIAHYYGCGDSLLRRAALPHPGRPFAEGRNRSGGEDDLLFAAMKRAGARFAWAPDALVYEDPTPERLTLGYALARAFAYGQGPTRACVTGRRDVAGVAYWMSVGLGQALVFGPIAAGKWLTRAPDRALALDRAVRGLGKTFWWGPFCRDFYGAPAPRPRSGPRAATAGGSPAGALAGIHGR